MSVAIKIENISKQYRLGLVSTRTLSHDLNRWWQTNILGKEDPYLKIDEGTRDRHSNRESVVFNEYIWALKGINLEIGQGEVLGIIGKNGAGKSTLLKILSKVTAPTTGTIKAKGRIASLLEVGTGFHQEMTGRENIFMNGAVLGMKKSEIKSKFDEIIEFSGIERYIDTPVKRYSSGMLVRLGFAVAAHLEPEILIVDEVLAIGDAEFQKKAIGKMQNISKEEGRTVLFVSHNMASIKELCTKGILLEEGSITDFDDTNKIVTKYLTKLKNLIVSNEWLGEKRPGNEYTKLIKAILINSKTEPINYAYINQKIGLCVEYEVLKDVPFFTHGINVYDGLGNHLFTSHDNIKYEGNKIKKKGIYKIAAWIPENLLQNGLIELSFACIRYNPFEVLFHVEKLIQFTMLDTSDSISRNNIYNGYLPGIMRPDINWEEIEYSE